MRFAKNEKCWWKVTELLLHLLGSGYRGRWVIIFIENRPLTSISTVRRNVCYTFAASIDAVAVLHVISPLFHFPCDDKPCKWKLSASSEVHWSIKCLQHVAFAVNRSRWPRGVAELRSSLPRESGKKAALRGWEWRGLVARKGQTLGVPWFAAQ